LIDLSDGEIATVHDTNPADQAWKGSHNAVGTSSPAVYQFTTPPQSYELTEAAATTIQPTQDGGKYIESQGSVFKDIRLSGTVGLRPNPVSDELFGGLAKATGIQLDVPTFGGLIGRDERGLPGKEKTGFDELIHLRNIFRAYYDAKSDPERARKIVMNFSYKKEGESYIVEPMRFVTSRDKSNPLGWNYSIDLRTVIRLDAVFTFEDDPINIFSAVKNLGSTLKKITKDISRALRQIASVIDALADIPGNMLNSVMSMGADILSGVAALRNSGYHFFDRIQSGFVKTAAVKAAELRGLIDEIRGSTAGDLMEGVLGVARHAVVRYAAAMEMLYCLDPLWAKSKQIQLSTHIKAYMDESGDLPLTSGSPLNPANIKIPSSAKEVTLNGMEDIRSLAKTYLGSEARWKELVILNNLKAPYIAAVASDGVLAPGNKLILPKEKTQLDDAPATVPRVTNQDQRSQDQSPIMRQYGRDIRIRPSSTGMDLADLVVNSRGDLDVIDGVDNVKQAMLIKFSTEQGELPLHPDFGAKYPIGSKVTFPKIHEFSFNTRRTLLQDPRVASISSLQMFVDGDTLVTDSRIRLKDADVELPITFSVRR
jgi:hypothetical protein